MKIHEVNKFGEVQELFEFVMELDSQPYQTPNKEQINTFLESFKVSDKVLKAPTALRESENSP